ncbi:MAG: STAS domain-containing protein [Chloroflexota bacterium]
MINTITKLELSGRFDAYQAQGTKKWLKDEVEKLSSQGVKANILVDMREVTFIDSAGLSALVVGIKKAREHGGTLHLFGLQQAVQIIFELSWLDKAFPIFANEEEATQAFS